MKKKILGLALLAMAAVSFGSFAQNKAQRPHKTQQCQEAKICSASDSCCEFMFFEGIELNDTQKDQIKQLNNNRKATREQAKKNRKEEKLRCDSVTKAQRAVADKAYLEQIKAIIGPENYVMYLENFYLNGNQKSPKGKTFKDGRRPAQKGPRPECNYRQSR